MTLLLIGVVGQVVALRVLAIQLARSPDDPPLLRSRVPTEQERWRRSRRHAALQRMAIVGFVLSTAVSVAGVLLLAST